MFGLETVQLIIIFTVLIFIFPVIVFVLSWAIFSYIIKRHINRFKNK
jgi:hypothetical protein